MENYDDHSKEELLRYVRQLEHELKYKKYGLVWDREREPEKVVLECQNNLPILKEINQKHIKTDDSSDNILIEGDNYHALSVLNYTHQNKIDVIYIDPPYNTGQKDFIYNDNFVDKEDKYRHSKWLNFMEKRLNLAKNLLKEDGVIIISIDDNELFNLKLLCDKVFGEDNFIANLPTIMNLKGNNDQFGFAGTHEYTLVYAKNIKNTKINHFDIDEEEILKQWQKDEKGWYKKGRTIIASGAESSRYDRIKSFFPVLIKNNKIELITCEEYKLLYDNEKQVFNDDYLEKLIQKYEKKGYQVVLPIDKKSKEYLRWEWGFEGKFKEQIDEIIIHRTKQGNITLYKKQRPEIGDLPTKKPKSLLYKPEYSSGNGTTLLKNIFNNKIFNNPKPLELIKDIIFLTSKSNSTILDFMAGSGTTAHAVLDINQKDNGNRKFILCTNNENNICQNVTYPRIKKVIQGYTTPKGKVIAGLGGNLKYFKTSLLPKSKSHIQTKINLVNECTFMLCIKENIYNLLIENDDFKFFISNDKKRVLAIYYNTEDESLKLFLDELKKIKQEKAVYIFSDTSEIDKTLCKGIKNCKLNAIPQKILDVYKQLNKQNIAPKTNTIIIDFEKAKKRIFEEKDKDDGASKLRVVLEQILEMIAYQNGLNLNDFTSISRINTKLKDDEVFNKVIWKANETYLTIGNDASHGDYDNFNMKQVRAFYEHIQSLIEEFKIGK